MNDAPRVRVCVYDGQGLIESEIRDPDALIEFATNPATIWADVVGVAGVDLLARLGEIFGLHSHLVQDLNLDHDTSRLEDYGNSYFIALKTIESAGWTSYPPLKKTATDQVSLVIGETFVLSFHQQCELFESVREQLRQGRYRLRNGGASHLVATLLDAVVTSCFPVLHGYESALEALEGEVARGPTPGIPETIQGLRRDLIRLSQTAWSLRELLTLLVRVAPAEPDVTAEPNITAEPDPSPGGPGTGAPVGAGPGFPPRAVRGAARVYLSGVSLRTNQAMKLLAVIAAIFLPLNFLVGFFGINLKSLQELAWSPAWLLLLMAGVAVLTVYWFRRRRWL